MPSARRWARSCSMRLLTSTRSVAISPGATPSAGVPQPSRWRRRTRCELSHACLEERDSSQGRDTGEFARNAIAQVSLAGLSLLAQTHLQWAAWYFRRLSVRQRGEATFFAGDCDGYMGTTSRNPIAHDAHVTHVPVVPDGGAFVSGNAQWQG